MIIQDVFYVTGRGYVITTRLEDDVINTGDKIDIGDEEPYTVIGIDRFRNAFGLSKNIGILIRGQLQHDKNSYAGKPFTVIKA